LDIEFLKAPLKQLVDDDDAAIDFLLKEACILFLVWLFCMLFWTFHKKKNPVLLIFAPTIKVTTK
jgi:hypothetical protein